MTEVDDRGRITIPKHLREEFNLTPGTNVRIKRRENKLVVERERSPEAIVAQLREPVEERNPTRETSETDSHACRHRENVRSLAERRDE